MGWQTWVNEIWKCTFLTELQLISPEDYLELYSFNIYSLKCHCIGVCVFRISYFHTRVNSSEIYDITNVYFYWVMKMIGIRGKFKINYIFRLVNNGTEINVPSKYYHISAILRWNNMNLIKVSRVTDVSTLRKQHVWHPSFVYTVWELIIFANWQFQEVQCWCEVVISGKLSVCTLLIRTNILCLRSAIKFCGTDATSICWLELEWH